MGMCPRSFGPVLPSLPVFLAIVAVDAAAGEPISRPFRGEFPDVALIARAANPQPEDLDLAAPAKPSLHALCGNPGPSVEIAAFRPEGGRIHVAARKPGAYWLCPSGWAP